jgi:hypothetical protein
MITSAEHSGWLGDVAISDLDRAGLPAPSIVRPAKIATIEARDAGPARNFAAAGPASGAHLFATAARRFGLKTSVLQNPGAAPEGSGSAGGEIDARIDQHVGQVADQFQ